MLTKILIILLVIAGVYATGRLHARSNGEEQQPNAPRKISPPSSDESRRNPYRYGLLALLVVATIAGSIAYARWSSGQVVQLIRVINSQSGKVVVYRARLKQIHHRDFTTLDGRRIRLADLERMEVEEAGTEK
uniref:Antitermination protein NusG n=1 Tax=Magnetococcus massalia (strain MO-1) TaxID=451514 RepID=A0A1S7LD17_MAGMO|nr:Conserved exported protein of unknown function [Candidatus Magnetococcus massalia]